MNAGIATILVIFGGLVVYVLLWLAVLCVRQAFEHRAVRRAEFALIAARVVEVHARPVVSRSAAVVPLAPLPVRRRRVEWVPPPPEHRGAHSASTGRHTLREAS